MLSANLWRLFGYFFVGRFFADLGKARAEFLNVTFFTQTKFEEKSCYPKKCVIFGSTKFAKKPRK